MSSSKCSVAECSSVEGGSDEKSGQQAKGQDGRNLTFSTQQESSSTVCRVCLSTQDIVQSIFDYIVDETTICAAITSCAYPLEISEDDQFSKHVCAPCLDNLRIAHNFRLRCLESDRQLRDERPNKRKLDEDAKSMDIVAEAAILADLTDSCIEVVYEKNATAPHEIVVKREGDGGPRRSKRARVKKVDNDYVMPLDFDEIERTLEQIHGGGDRQESLVKEETRASLQEVLDELTDDNGGRDREVLEEIRIPRGLTIRPVGPSSNKKFVVRTKFPTDNFPPPKRRTPPKVSLPRSVRIRPVEAYRSATGRFQFVQRDGLFGSRFVEADGYLFARGLIKHGVRTFKCTLPTCDSVAHEEESENGKHTDHIGVIVPHNHTRPSVVQEMFLSVMRKKMQVDRALNIRHIYEEACAHDASLKKIMPLRYVINEVCRHQVLSALPPIADFVDFFGAVDTEHYDRLQFTQGGQQFYQHKFHCPEDGSMAVLFANGDVIEELSDCTVMYVDASFRMDTCEDFKYQLVTVLVWIGDSYYPIVYALVNKKSGLIYKKIFGYIKDELAKELCPKQIVTDYEANLHYALLEVYTKSSVGGSVFYYAQNLYKKMCSLNLCRDLETNSYFRNIYHMLLMLPLLPVNTILDGLNNIELEAKHLNVSDLARPIFDYVRTQWIINVTPELFCTHKLEYRINENVIAPFKKLRDFLLLTKGKERRGPIKITYVVEKIIELEGYLRTVYSKPDKKTFSRDLSSFQKKNVLRAWQYIEEHPKIEINGFFNKVLGYVRCMENQLWIWGFYRYSGDADEELINAVNFATLQYETEAAPQEVYEYEDEAVATEVVVDGDTIVMEAVIDQDGILQREEEEEEAGRAGVDPQRFESAFLKYINLS